MPRIRSYSQVTSLQPTDAFVIDVLGVGTKYVEAQNFAGTGAIETTLLTISSATTVLGAPTAQTWYIDITNTSGIPITIKLPADPSTSQVVKLTDVGGNAGTYGWTIEDSAGGALTPAAAVSVDYGWLTARWNGVRWVQG